MVIDGPVWIILVVGEPIAADRVVLRRNWAEVTYGGKVTDYVNRDKIIDITTEEPTP